MEPAKVEPQCAGCLQKLPNKEKLTCKSCNKGYDLQCANITITRFNKTMTLAQKKTWICQDCSCKIPKTGNVNTPIRVPTNSEIQEINSPPEENNVTFRKRATNSSPNSPFSQSLSILGDTQFTDNKDPPLSAIIQEELTLKNLNDIIILRLRENNKAIIVELQNTIQIEINKAINKVREDFESKTDTLSKVNKQQREDIATISKKIEMLTIENEKIKTEIKNLTTLKTEKSLQCTENNRRKIVLYGFPEYYREPDYDQQYRLIDLLYENLNIDLTGYIEETYRLGRKHNKNRPLVIELISKRMAKYIIENKQCLQGTRLYVSEFLDEISRSQRKEMHEEMLKARKKGLYAIIRNNQLFIEGKTTEIQKQDLHINNTPMQSEQNQTQHDIDKVSDNHTHSFRNPRPTI